MKIVRPGTWLYDGTASRPVDVVALDFDWWFELGRCEGSLEEGEEPQALGPDGFLYYVRFKHAGETNSPTWVESGGHTTIDDAMTTAAARVPSPIAWHA